MASTSLTPSPLRATSGSNALLESEGRADARPSSVHPHLLRLIPILLILGLLVHLLLPRIGTIAEALQTMRSMLPLPLALAVLAECLSYIANANVLRSVLRIAGAKLELRRAVAIELGAGAVALVAAGPVGFGASIFRWTKRRGVPASAAMLASWLPSTFDAVALVIFAMIGAIELLFTHKLSRTTLIAVVIVVCALGSAIAAIVVLLTRGEWLSAIARRVQRLIASVRPSADSQSLIRGAELATETWKSMRGGGWIAPMASAMLVLTFDLLCLRYAFVATGHQIYFHLLLAGYGVPILLGRTSFIPGGVAVIEVGMAALFAGLGVPANVAVVSVLTYRLISFWLPAAIGTPIAIALHSRH